MGNFHDIGTTKFEIYFFDTALWYSTYQIAWIGMNIIW